MRNFAEGRSRAWRGLLAIGLVALTGGATRGADGPSPASYIPRESLVTYIEFAGLDAQQAAWKGTAAYGLLNKTTCGAMLKDVVAQTIDGMLTDSPAGKPSGAEVVGFVEEFARSGFVLGVNGKLGSDDLSALLVIPHAPASAWTKALALMGRGAGKVERIGREDGRKVSVAHLDPKQDLAWWFEGKDLLISLGKTDKAVDPVVETILGKRPNAVDLPLRKELWKTADGFTPALISFVDLASLPPTPPNLGQAGLKRVDSRWGFQGEALMNRMRIVAPKPRKGVLALMDGPSFAPGGTLPVAADAAEFTVFSTDLLKLHDQISALAKEMNPALVPQIDGMTKAIEGMTGLKLREEILGLVGPRIAIYSTSDKVSIPISPYQILAQWFLHLPKLTIVAEIKDRAAFGKSLDALMTVANRRIQAEMTNQGKEGTVAFRPLKGGEAGYELDVPFDVLPLPNGIRPTIRVGRNHVAISTDAEGAKVALAFESERGVRPLSAQLGRAIAGLPGRVTLLNISDPTEYLPELIADLPFLVQALAMTSRGDPSSPLKGIKLKIDRDKIPTPASMRPYLFPASMSFAVDDEGMSVIGREAFPSLNSVSATPVLVALLLPAVQSARSAARRAQSTNNIKQIMLAYHNFHAANNTFPPASISDGEGKPLLSWRVAILPYIEQEALYKEFHLDEPWDSPHNKTLISRMPTVYASTTNPPKVPFSTYYQTFVGEGALNEKVGGKGTGLEQITDGTSNTIAVVEAGEAVIWTKPDDIKFDIEKPLPKFGGMGFPGGYNAGFCDGSVRFLKFSIDMDVLKHLITKAGGEVINADDF